MASGESSKKVSSVFITLATPHQAKAKQHSGNKKGWVHAGPSQRSSGSHSSATEELSQMSLSSESRASVQSGHNMGMLWENDNKDVAGSSDVFSPPALPPSPPSLLHSYLPDPVPTPSPPPAQKPVSRPPSSPRPTPSPPPAQKPVSRPPSSPQPPPPNKEVAPSSGTNAKTPPNEIHEDYPSESRGLCGFCRKPIPFSEPALTALKRIYHKGCFTCRTCSSPLAGKTFYHSAEIPECEACHENSLERCWSCGEKIRGQLIRALQRTYHTSCFTCATCKQPLENFMQADSGEVYCYLDYSRMFAKKCSACHQLIIASDGSLPGHIESNGRHFHKECYRCEVCHFKFSLEKEEYGCYSVNGKRLCLTCCQKQ
ncbi:filamin-binding LIM protein 1 [Hippocampus comes]|uniref:Filamin binding LIM protein 1 n=1 Tax=Hippocampus comes TaxID=109280 RepID=A0A3Q2XJ48_HIPCM|nr:PREDICTED: filamin-binding LIM protein 1-like [Hippocampus comes]XP_019736869.1 PREDICTED: filamin-binding LIM protein 1-like [Hippocampus comes]